MFLVWAGTIAGVVLIVLHTGGWPYSLAAVMTNPHPVLGLAALVLTFIQPLMALCRPTPVSPLRSRLSSVLLPNIFWGIFLECYTHLSHNYYSLTFLPFK